MWKDRYTIRITVVLINTNAVNCALPTDLSDQECVHCKEYVLQQIAVRNLSNVPTLQAVSTNKYRHYTVYSLYNWI
uniref:Uncharacterized protein n=1 Tax=Anguilla anguilla TaxID=7936 RepID=A0A0E9VNQ8_ANGAN